MQNQDEEREYQKFIAKLMKASKDFVDDYNKLSQTNKFQQVLFEKNILFKKKKKKKKSVQ